VVKGFNASAACTEDTSTDNNNKVINELFIRIMTRFQIGLALAISSLSH